jgi:hypothetical protein
MLSRFDFNKNQRDLLNLAVSLGIIDAVELGCMMAEHGADFTAITDEISEACWASRLEMDRAEARSAWIDACDNFHAQRASA